MEKDTEAGELITMEYDTWEARFRPVKNMVDETAPYGGMMWETYGAQLCYVLMVANGHTGKAGERKVWTLVDDDNGDRVICEGYHLCNRIGYFITEKPAKVGAQYNITGA